MIYTAKQIYDARWLIFTGNFFYEIRKKDKRKQVYIRAQTVNVHGKQYNTTRNKHV